MSEPGTYEWAKAMHQAGERLEAYVSTYDIWYEIIPQGPASDWVHPWTGKPSIWRIVPERTPLEVQVQMAERAILRDVVLAAMAKVQGGNV